MPLRGEIAFPGDKSISHRAFLLAALTDGECVIENHSTGEDVESSRQCLLACGIGSTRKHDRTVINGGTFLNPNSYLDCGNSGTSVRLLIGLLSGRGVSGTLIGDDSLSRRPMKRVIRPLQMMRAKIDSADGYLPVHLHENPLQGIEYVLPVASAQVKSAVLLAGLGAEGKTTVIENLPTRDHTEIMLKNMGADIELQDNRISVSRLSGPLEVFRMKVPGDPSTAAFFAAAAAIVPGSELLLKGVSANPTRTGFYSVLEKMGGKMECLKQWTENGEQVGDLRISTGSLQGVTITRKDIPRLIDELPILAVLATQAEGKTEVREASELRVKECDRINAICLNLSRMGANIIELEDGFIIEGPTPLKGGNISTFGDHRIAMAFTIAGLITKSPLRLDNADCINISCPEFQALLKKVTR